MNRSCYKYPKKVLILKTSIATCLDLVRIGKFLIPNPHITSWHVDLEDCDKVLRIECYGLEEEDIVKMLRHTGLKAEKLQ